MSPHKKNDTLSEEIIPLENAANEWTKDPTESTESEVLSETTQASSVPVHFVADPLGMTQTDIKSAQANDEYLLSDDEEPTDEDVDADLDLELESKEEELVIDEAEIDQTLESLKAAMAEQEKLEEVALTQIAEQDEAEAQKLLASQIAEDEALEQEMREENENANVIDPDLLAALPSHPSEDEHGNLDLAEMESCIEALLFMVEKPMSANKLRDLLGPEMPLHFFQEALTHLKSRYQRLHHGFELVEIANGYQFRTKPVRAALAKKLAKIQTQRLSTGAMETLAIVAYKQPVMKDDVDQIRGVDSSHFIRGLLDKKLIKITGRSELPGRPMLYETTSEFLEVFGLKNLQAMPSLREIEGMVPGSQGGKGEDDPRVKEMRRLVGEMKADTSTSLIYDPKEDEKFLSEIKERVGNIAVSTPSIDEQKAREKAIAEGRLDPRDIGENSEMPL
jgi:segregation and condensation protein B